MPFSETEAAVFHVVLYEPEIPANTGNIGRLCVATGVTLHLVGRPGFHLDDRSLRRAGLDYWHEVRLVRHETLAAVWPSVTEGLSFNTMSKHVDWERDDLFHWPLDDVMAFAKANLSRHVAFNLDYGLWEVAVHVHRSPVQPAATSGMWLVWKLVPKTAGVPWVVTAGQPAGRGFWVHLGST